MKIDTTRFGEIEIDESKIIDFPLGVPGFSELKRYVLLDYKEPVRWLHAVDDKDIAFIVTDPFIVFHDYSVDLNDEEEKFLDIKEPVDIVVLVILTVSDNSLTANLKAPIVLNSSKRKAAQIILDDERYQFKVPLPSIPKESSK